MPGYFCALVHPLSVPLTTFSRPSNPSSALCFSEIGFSAQLLMMLPVLLKVGCDHAPGLFLVSQDGMENHLLMSLCMPQRVLLGSHCSSCLKGLCCPPSGSHHCLFLGRVSHCNPDWHGIGDVAGLSLFLLPQLPRAGIT